MKREAIKRSKAATKSRVADALYILAQVSGASGDWGTLDENPDLKKKYEYRAGALMGFAHGTSFCRDFVSLVDRNLCEVDP